MTGGFGYIIGPGPYAGIDIANGLTIFDASAPTELTVIASFPFEDVPVAIDVVGNYVYLTHQHQVEHPHIGGMDIIDVSDPRAPKRVATFDVQDPANGLRVVGGRAYLTRQAGNLEIVDVNEPTAPTLLGTCALSGSGLALQVAGTTVYVAAGDSGLLVVDASAPAAPKVIGSQRASGKVAGIDLSGNRAYVTSGLDNSAPAAFSGLQVIDVSVPTAPTLLRALPTQDALAVRVLGTNAYVTDSEAGLLVIDATDASAPRVVGSYALPGSGTDLWVANNLAYVAGSGGGLSIVDVGQPARPPQLGAVETPGDALGVAVAGNLAYVADGHAGLQIVDVSDLSTPALGASYDTPGTAGAVKVVGNAVYVVDSAQQDGDVAGLRVLSLGGGTVKPYWQTSFDAPTSVWSPRFQVSGHYVYLVSEGLKIIDLAPLVPTLVGGIAAGQFPWTSYLTDLSEVVGDQIIGVGDGWELLDVKNVAAPAPLSRYQLPSPPGSPTSGYTISAIALAGSNAYVLGATFTALDVTARAAPVPLGSCEMPAEASGVQVAGTNAYVSAMNHGLSVIDVSNPAAPALTAAYGTRGFMRASGAARAD